ncbi:MAG: hypothetical protein KTR14_09915 [Vampirovibrio sp.]|nr:hypothetical protein [Vampirovibrio sp.]
MAGTDRISDLSASNPLFRHYPKALKHDANEDGFLSETEFQNLWNAELGLSAQDDLLNKTNITAAYNYTANLGSTFGSPNDKVSLGEAASLLAQMDSWSGWFTRDPVGEISRQGVNLAVSSINDEGVSRMFDQQIKEKITGIEQALSETQGAPEQDFGTIA